MRVGTICRRIHHALVEHELVPFDFRLRVQLFSLIVAHDIVWVLERKGAWIFGRALQLGFDVVFEEPKVQLFLSPALRLNPRTLHLTIFWCVRYP